MWFAVPRSFHFVLKNKTLNLSILARLSDLRQFVNMTSHLVFVYGTLKRGQPNHEKMTNPDNGQATFIGEARTVEKWPLVIATKFNIPFMLDKPGLGHHVTGEVFKVDENMLDVLDELERHPVFYRRRLTNIQLTHTKDAISTADDMKAGEQEMCQSGEGTILECMCYFIPNFRDELLEITFDEAYDGYRNPRHAYIPREKRTMTKEEQRLHVRTYVQKQ
ncbi:putative gamma-glutamylcyclotransferase CG2811 isoform X2 [Amphiura filiformis]|uniref:putative gamma-glutamylcyclotransferase CG2811 isoform X2 n=1 Tax=Amphiura filiformis TaxID=82378 RepID=UPI003B20EC55